MPAPRAHVATHVRVVPVQHGDVLNAHTEVSACHTTTTTTTTTHNDTRHITTQHTTTPTNQTTTPTNQHTQQKAHQRTATTHQLFLFFPSFLLSVLSVLSFLCLSFLFCLFYPFCVFSSCLCLLSCVFFVPHCFQRCVLFPFVSLLIHVFPMKIKNVTRVPLFSLLVIPSNLLAVPFHLELHITKLIARLVTNNSLITFKNGSFSTPNFVMHY